MCKALGLTVLQKNKIKIANSFGISVRKITSYGEKSGPYSPSYVDLF